MSVAEYTIRNKVLSIIIIMLIIGGGLKAYSDMARFEDPEFTIRTAQVIVNYPGASPFEVAEEVAAVLEREIMQMQEVEEITSTISAGQAVLAVDILYEFSQTNSDLEIVWTKLRNRVSDAKRHLPKGVTEPLVNDDFGDVFGLYYFLTSDGYSPKEVRQYAKELQSEILQLEGIAKVTFDGTRDEAIFIEISSERTKALGVSIANVYEILSQQNAVVAAGDIKVGNNRLKISPTGGIDSVEAIQNTLINHTADGAVVYLSDIANVYRGYQDARKIYHYNGQPAVAFGISAMPGTNIVKIGQAVNDKLAESESRRPIGIELHSFYHQGEEVAKSVEDFINNVVLALIIVLVTLLLFMGFKSALVISIVLLLTILATLATMDIVDIPMHRISLGALIIALGMMVDNAIVVTEGILIGIKRGLGKIEISKIIVKQTQWPLLGGTLVGIIAFAPIGFAPGAAAEYTGHLFWVILISLGFSWVFALTLTPLLCYWLFKTPSSDEEQTKQNSVFITTYQKILRSGLKFRKMVIVGTLAIFITSMWAFQFVKEGFFPDSTLPIIVVDYWLPQGTDLSKTKTDVIEIESFLMQLEGVNAVNTTIGGSNLRFMLLYPPENPNPAFSRLLVRVDDWRNIDNIMPVIQNHIENAFPEAQTKAWRVVMGPAGGSKIEATFKGPDPIVLRSLVDEAKKIMAEDGEAILIKDDWRQPVSYIEPIYSASKGRRAGVSREDLARALATVYSGRVIGHYREGDDQFPIITQAPLNERLNAADMRNIQVTSSVTGAVVPIGQITDGFRTSWRSEPLRRVDRIWTMKAQSDPKAGELASVIHNRFKEEIESIALPDGYTLEWDGEYGDSKRANENLGKTLPLGLLAMVIIVFVLFGTVKQPVIIWLVVPLALVGVVAGLIIMGIPLEFMGVLGVLSLSGLLIKNAIVLIDQIDLEIAEGKPRLDALVEASASRVRPVAMGALTTALGVITLYFDAFFQSMSVVLFFGLTFATLLTLIFVPILYAAFFNINNEETAGIQS